MIIASDEIVTKGIYPELLQDDLIYNLDKNSKNVLRSVCMGRNGIYLEDSDGDFPFVSPSGRHLKRLVGILEQHLRIPLFRSNPTLEYVELRMVNYDSGMTMFEVVTCTPDIAL